jgi:hypothetical protein
VDPAAASTNWTPWIEVGVIVLVIVGLVGLWVLRKGRRLSGEHVFRASRWSRGNRLFPTQVLISPSSLTAYRPQWIGKNEESIHMAHVASIKIDTGLVFSDVFIETSGGQAPVVCHGHTKRDAVQMKQLIEKYQSEYYRTSNPHRVKTAVDHQDLPGNRSSGRPE